MTAEEREKKIKEEEEKRKKRQQNDTASMGNKMISEDGTLSAFGFSDSYE
jgi:hypothetical protein